MSKNYVSRFKEFCLNESLRSIDSDTSYDIPWGPELEREVMDGNEPANAVQIEDFRAYLYYNGSNGSRAKVSIRLYDDTVSKTKPVIEIRGIGLAPSEYYDTLSGMLSAIRWCLVNDEDGVDHDTYWDDNKISPEARKWANSDRAEYLSLLVSDIEEKHNS